ncbi:ABC transporter permease [Pseudonocardia broussonetiae]|uniref:Transport permease protein n=1 Tax=Pseudonocardia broussonetiae TaxID=2736640 RepID=A0A6M6JTG3_9PSEU|nr:ABC transporter permease [Pseudonocardia broussonetiae]
MTDALTLSGRSVRLARRNVDTLVMSIVLPVLMMLLFVLVLGGAIDTGGAYLTYVVPGIVVLCTGYGASATAMSVTHDMTGGMVDRLRSMPVHASAVLTGHVVASVTRNAVSTTLVVAVAVALGFRPSAGVVEWVLAAGLLLLYVLALSWLAAAFGVVARTVESAGLLSFLMLFLPYLSSAFVPTATMPAFLRGIGEHQPITSVVETVRALLTGAPADRGGVALAWTLGLLVAGVVLASVLFRRRTRA